MKLTKKEIKTFIKIADEVDTEEFMTKEAQASKWLIPALIGLGGLGLGTALGWALRRPTSREIERLRSLVEKWEARREREIEKKLPGWYWAAERLLPEAFLYTYFLTDHIRSDRYLKESRAKSKKMPVWLIPSIFTGLGGLGIGALIGALLRTPEREKRRLKRKLLFLRGY